MILRRMDSRTISRAFFFLALPFALIAVLSICCAGKSFLNSDSARTLSFPLRGSSSGKAENTSYRIKLAEGEYAVTARSNEGGVGPFDPQVFDFRESWTLWRPKGGGYEADGVREFSSPKDEFHRDRFWLRLTRDWRLETIKADEPQVEIGRNCKTAWRDTPRQPLRTE